MGNAIATQAVAQCVHGNHVRVDGVILDSPFCSFMDYFKYNYPNTYYYGSFVFDWPKVIKIADVEFDSAKVMF